ncbi:NAD(P)-dependent oxidoreductase [Biformimicrobium ophioploci]|uniref:NAD(P)-binding domain-containing protein n=1 Tax=Biformimicrobium ophioploci TaxID=3036711 RepID=A0ABQ6LW05_9GAMM|nr:NAD(P)H-binding protein [Microbulbifer sp. NKW57]GMG86279.1 hypothetical protein MNKW57_06000 [Microbulbifer sp. NKW57]
MDTTLASGHLLVLGASGRTGQQLVRLALDAGYRVTACARKTESIPGNHPRLCKCALDINDAASILAALDPVPDAVLSTLGIFHKTDSTPLADGTRNILSAMQDRGVRRLVLMSSLGVGDSRGQGNFIVALVSRFILPYVLRDKELQERLVKTSGLDWTILRPPQLLPSDQSRFYEMWEGDPPKKRLRWKISTLDAAQAMLNVLRSPNSCGRQYQISY